MQAVVSGIKSDTCCADNTAVSRLKVTILTNSQFISDKSDMYVHKIQYIVQTLCTHKRFVHSLYMHF